MSTSYPSQGDLDTHWGFAEVRDPCCGRSGVADPRQPGTPPHHWRVDDACGECVEWDLLWVGPDDVFIVEMIVITMQAASEP